MLGDGEYFGRRPHQYEQPPAKGRGRAGNGHHARARPRGSPTCIQHPESSLDFYGCRRNRKRETRRCSASGWGRDNSPTTWLCNTQIEKLERILKLDLPSVEFPRSDDTDMILLGCSDTSEGCQPAMPERQTRPVTVQSDEIEVRVLRLRLAIARAAQRNSLSWWDDASLTPDANLLLRRLFPRSVHSCWLGACSSSRTRAARGGSGRLAACASFVLSRRSIRELA